MGQEAPERARGLVLTGWVIGDEGAWPRGSWVGASQGQSNGAAGICGGGVQGSSGLALEWSQANGVAGYGSGAGRVNLCGYHANATLLGLFDL